MHPQVSIIVPVYNTEPFLRQCLDSILGQTLTGIEVIVVNDGSPDGSQAIIDEYAARDPRIRIIRHDRNRGLGAARNSGVAMARGEYLGFVDSDDWVDGGMFESMVREARQEDAGVVECNITAVYPDRQAVMFSRHCRQVFRGAETAARFLDGFHLSICNKIVEADLWRKHGLSFPDYIGEDQLPAFRALYHARAAVLLPRSYYFYRKGFSGSITSSRGPAECLRRLEGMRLACAGIRQFLEQEKMAVTLRHLHQRLCNANYYWLLDEFCRDLSRREQEELFSRLLEPPEEACRDLDRGYPRWLHQVWMNDASGQPGAFGTAVRIIRRHPGSWRHSIEDCVRQLGVADPVQACWHIAGHWEQNRRGEERPLAVIFIPPSTPGGAGRAFASLANGLAGQDYRVTVLTTGPPEPEDDPLDSRIVTLVLPPGPGRRNSVALAVLLAADLFIDCQPRSEAAVRLQAELRQQGIRFVIPDSGAWLAPRLTAMASRLSLRQHELESLGHRLREQEKRADGRLQDEEKRAGERIQELEKVAARWQQELEAHRERLRELEAIKQSRGWRTLQKYYRLRNRLLELVKIRPARSAGHASGAGAGSRLLPRRPAGVPGAGDSAESLDAAAPAVRIEIASQAGGAEKPSPAARPVINSMWTGSLLSPMELLTMKSFLAHGHRFRLWIYGEEPAGLPDGIELREAGAILPASRIFKNERGWNPGSYAAFSDLFRYRLLLREGGWWVDMDVLCLQPFDFPEPYVFRPHHELKLAGNIMKCPPGSPLMEYCFTQANRLAGRGSDDWYELVRILNTGVVQLGLESYLVSRDVFGDDREESHFPYLLHGTPPPPGQRALHWCNANIARSALRKDRPVAGSFYARSLARYGVPAGPGDVLECPLLKANPGGNAPAVRTGPPAGRRVDTRVIPAAPDEVRCFLVQRNEYRRLPYFLHYHRQLGVGRFLVVDNGSTDGSLEYLNRQPDVHLWHNPGSYQRAKWGQTWINGLLEEYGDSCWCLILDADELFFFPYCDEGLSIRGFTGWLDRNRYNLCWSILLDMYSDRPADATRCEPGQDPLTACPFYEYNRHPGLMFDRSPARPEVVVGGNVRERIFGIENAVQKYNLLRGGEGLELQPGTHICRDRRGKARLAGVSALTLHFKYLSGFSSSITEAIARGEHYDVESQYRGFLGRGHLKLHHPRFSRRFAGSPDLLERGLLRTEASFQQFAGDRLGRDLEEDPRLRTFIVLCRSLRDGAPVLDMFRGQPGLACLPAILNEPDRIPAGLDPAAFLDDFDGEGLFLRIKRLTPGAAAYGFLLAADGLPDEVVEAAVRRVDLVVLVQEAEERYRGRVADEKAGDWTARWRIRLQSAGRPVLEMPAAGRPGFIEDTSIMQAVRSSLELPAEFTGAAVRK